MMLIEECPECGNHTTTDDGHSDDFVVQEVCDRCRNREADARFDAGFAEYERSMRAEPDGSERA